jgi:ectoine hydroxylase-related dioxygenase (phytanoyl-CoA dioxygenase family)
MLEVPVLSEEQIADFERDGYLVVRGAFGAETTARIERWCDELTAMPEEPGKHWVFWEQSLTNLNEKIRSRIENISANHAGFAKLTAALKAPVGQLLGEEAVLFKEKINFKLPGGDGFKPHQDAQAGWDVYADFFVNVLVCIDEATEENGCLKVVRGHHKRGLFRMWEPLDESDMQGMEFVACPTKPGDLIFFDCYAPHASEPNRSKHSRRLYYVTYNRFSAGDNLPRYYADKRRSYPPDIEREAGKDYVFRV